MANYPSFCLIVLLFIDFYWVTLFLKYVHLKFFQLTKIPPVFREEDGLIQDSSVVHRSEFNLCSLCFNILSPAGWCAVFVSRMKSELL